MGIPLPIHKGWMPDKIPFGMPEGGLVIAENILPTDGRYITAQDKQTYSSSAVASAGGGKPSRAIELKLVSGDYYGFIGTHDKLYRLNTDKTLTDKTRVAGGAYTTGDNQWNFEQYGDWILATNFSDDIQIFKDFGGAGAFVSLASEKTGTDDPPKAKYMLLYKGHLILGYVNAAGPKKIQWSALEDVGGWDQSLTTGADSQNFPDGKGEITGLARVGNGFAVFHENSINTGYYSGAPYTFAFQHNRIDNVGCYVPGSLISVGGIAYFWGEDDIYMFDGQTLTPIGTNLKDTVIDSLNTAAMNQVSVAHDNANGLIWWSYPTGSDTNATKVLVYNYREKRFTQLELTMHTIFHMHSGALLMDDMDSLYPDISDMPYNMDSRAYQSGSPVMACVDTDLYVDTLDGVVLAGKLTTGEFKNDDKVMMVDRVRPRADSYNSISVRVGTRFEENDTVVYSGDTVVGANGYADVRASGRYVSFELTFTNHNGIFDMEFNAEEVGLR